ncbi:MAG: hypothetical protein ACE5G9_02590 [Nitrospinales bacterium]
MNPLDESPNWIYEKLHNAIMKAIVSSGEVRELLRELQSEGRIDGMAVMNVILSLEELSESIHSASRPADGEPETRQSGKLKPHDEDFDENLWLKKAGIKF